MLSERVHCGVFVCVLEQNRLACPAKCSSCLSERPGGGLASSSSSRALLPIAKTGLFALSFNCRSCCSSSSSLSTLASRLFCIRMGRGCNSSASDKTPPTAMTNDANARRDARSQRLQPASGIVASDGPRFQPSPCRHAVFSPYPTITQLGMKKFHVRYFKLESMHWATVQRRRGFHFLVCFCWWGLGWGC
jgi:hypothetical protein